MLLELPQNQRELADYMSELSEIGYHAGWMQIFDDDTEETWIPLAEWERRFAAWDKARKVEGT